jgi:uncharacterized protein YdaU (DUF1376 family)
LQRALRKRKKSPIEFVYRHFWHRKGDVFHLLLNLALVLDNRWAASRQLPDSFTHVRCARASCPCLRPVS